jgi:restriction endonuclease Mrr
MRYDHAEMSDDTGSADFPYSFPQYLSPVLRILSDGHDRSIECIREKLLREFPFTPIQLSMKRHGYPVTVFHNKVAFAFNRLVHHKAIVQIIPGSYRISDHGRDILKRSPNSARERGL